MSETELFPLRHSIPFTHFGCRKRRRLCVKTVAATHHGRDRVTETVLRCMTWIGFLYVHFTDFYDGITVVDIENLLRFEETKG